MVFVFENNVLKKSCFKNITYACAIFNIVYIVVYKVNNLLLLFFRSVFFNRQINNNKSNYRIVFHRVILAQ